MVGGIESSEKRPYRRHNFEHCSGPRRQGQIVMHEDGVKSWIPYRCGESLCPACADKVGKDLGREYGEVFEAVARAKRIRRAWFVVMTLPREVEAIPVPGSEEDRALRRAIAIMLRRSLGQRSRAQLPMYLATHVVGDRSLMRRRVHYHAGVLPMVMKNDHVEVLRIRSLDLEAMRLEWKQILQDVFHRQDLEPQIHVSWIDPIKAPAKLHHRIKYDVRAFGADFRDAPLTWSPSTGLVVVREGSAWRVVHVLDLAEQWAWVRRRREVRPYGPLQYRRRAAEVLGIEQITEEVPPAVDELPAMEWTYRVKRITAEGKVKWHTVVSYWLDLPGGWEWVPGEVSAGRGGRRWQVKTPQKHESQRDVGHKALSPPASALWVPLFLPGLGRESKSGLAWGG